MRTYSFITNLCWIGDNTLLLEYEDGDVQLNIDLESLEESGES